MMVIPDSSFCDLQRASVYLNPFYAWEKGTEAVMSHQKTGLFNWYFLISLRVFCISERSS